MIDEFDQDGDGAINAAEFQAIMAAAATDKDA
jgi:Ca2+-binding EF-hand superfamily protein